MLSQSPYSHRHPLVVILVLFPMLTIFLFFISQMLLFPSSVLAHPSSSPAPIVLSTSTQNLPVGEQKILVIMYNFQNNSHETPFTKEEVSALIFSDTPPSLNSYYKEVSFDKTWFTGDVVGWYTVPIDNSGSSCIDASREAEEIAKQDGIDVDSYPRRIYITPWKESCGTSGSTDGNPSTISINGYPGVDVLIHEIGHNLTLGHAHALVCLNQVITHYSLCQVQYYGDLFTAMGKGNMYHHSAYFKAFLGWLLPSQTLIATQNGSYTLYPIETQATASQIQDFKIPKPNTNEFYHFEFRKPLGYDQGLIYTGDYGIFVRIGYFLPYVIGSSHIFYFPESYLLDTHPQTFTLYDAPLKVGDSFVDPINKITVTYLNHDENSATVSLNFSPPPITSDVNLDESIDSADIKPLAESYNRPLVPYSRYDLNQDQKLNAQDIVQVLTSF